MTSASPAADRLAADALADRLAALYPVLDENPPPDWRADVAALGAALQVPAGTLLFDEGRQC